MGQFDALIKGGTPTNDGHGGAFTEYKLANDYDLQANNCTTMCLNGLFNTEASTGTLFKGLELFRGGNDPRELFKSLQENAVTPSGGQTYAPGTVLRVCTATDNCHYEMR